MTEDEIEIMAIEVGLEPVLGSLRDGDGMWIECDVLGSLKKFAELVAKREREKLNCFKPAQ